jgi:hypothetical protein
MAQRLKRIGSVARRSGAPTYVAAGGKGTTCFRACGSAPARRQSLASIGSDQGTAKLGVRGPIARAAEHRRCGNGLARCDGNRRQRIAGACTRTGVWLQSLRAGGRLTWARRAASPGQFFGPRDKPWGCRGPRRAQSRGRQRRSTDAGGRTLAAAHVGVPEGSAVWRFSGAVGAARLDQSGSVGISCNRSESIDINQGVQERSPMARVSPRTCHGGSAGGRRK